MKVVGIVLAVCLTSPVLAETSSAILDFLDQENTNAVFVTTHTNRLKALACHCTTRWDETPVIRMVDMGTGKFYGEEQQCGQGPLNSDVMKLNKRVYAGRHIGVMIMNQPMKSMRDTRAS